MAWYQHDQAKTPQEILDLLSQVFNEYRIGKKMIFRGQSDCSWPLRSSITRRLEDHNITDKSEAEVIERELIEIFKHEVRRQNLPIDEPPSEKLEWWAIMQHFGAPTRLLDWSRDYLVALYFAVRSDWKNNGAVFYANYELLEGVTIPYAKNEIEFGIVPYELSLKNMRVQAQRGVFTIGADPLSYHDPLLDSLFGNPTTPELLDYWKTYFGKIIIPKESKPQLLQHLISTFETSGAVLFPGLDGIWWSIADQIALKCKGLDGTSNSYGHWKATGLTETFPRYDLGPGKW